MPRLPVAGSDAELQGKVSLPSIQAVVSEIVKDLVGQEVAADAPLAAQGLDSLAAMELRQRLQVGLIMIDLNMTAGDLQCALLLIKLLKPASSSVSVLESALYFIKADTKAIFVHAVQTMNGRRTIQYGYFAGSP